MVEFKKASHKDIAKKDDDTLGGESDLGSANIFHELNKEDVTDPKLKWRKTLSIDEKDGLK